jgi:hypothetical protein
MLLYLPNGHDAEQVRDALIATVSILPEHLRGSLTWDRGAEMARHQQFAMATDMAVYFCDPACPWQRGSNENTAGCCASTSPRAQTCVSTVPKTSNTSPRNSTGDHAKRSAGRPQPSVCVIYSPPRTKAVLQGPVESAHRGRAIVKTCG